MIYLKWKRVQDDKYELRKVRAFKRDELPKSYFKVYPHCFVKDKILYIYFRRDGNKEIMLSLKKGSVIKEQDLETWKGVLEKCGQNLRDINYKIWRI